MHYFGSGSRSSKPRQKFFAVKLSVGLAILALVLAACQGGASTPTPTSTTTPTMTATPTASSTPAPIPTPMASPTPTPIPTPVASQMPTPIPTLVASPTPTSRPMPTATPTPTPQSVLPEDLFLEITEPTTESIVYDSPLALVGLTTPDAVVSVDGNTVEVNAQGQFVALLSLEPGPNVIEVVASDLSGTQETALLALIHIPRGSGG